MPRSWRNKGRICPRAEGTPTRNRSCASAAILQKKQPESLTTFHAQSLLGDVLLGQKKYADAEPLLVRGYEGLKAREGDLPLYARYRVAEAGQRIVRLYEAWGRAEKAAEWRTKLRHARMMAQPAPVAFEIRTIGLSPKRSGQNDQDLIRSATDHCRSPASQCAPEPSHLFRQTSRMRV